MKRAVIAGGSIAGLSAAKALSANFEDIFILEPDPIDKEEKGVRKGTPQANHVHGLLKGGGDALTGLFPNLPDRLEKKGAVSCDFCQEVRWYINKRWMPRFRGPLPIYFQTRPLLESCIREEVQELPNVHFMTGCRVADFALDPTGTRVVQVSIDHEDGAREMIDADFFIDAMGRGSLLPRWLSENGFGSVPEGRIKVDLGYASCLLELPEEDRDWKSILIYPKGPDEVRGSTLVKVEEGKWLLTLAGYHNEHPPAEVNGFMAFAKSLPQPDIYDAVKNAKIVSDIRIHKFPHGQWRHYDELASFPLGILPAGDTNASLNPLFGQGMSVAALSVQALWRLAERTDFDDARSLEKLKTSYFKELRKIFATPWDLAAGQDFRYPKTTGNKPSDFKLKNILKELIMGASSTEIIKRFYEVVHLVEDEKSFYHPKWIYKYLLSAIKNDK